MANDWNELEDGEDIGEQNANKMRNEAPCPISQYVCLSIQEQDQSPL